MLSYYNLKMGSHQIRLFGKLLIFGLLGSTIYFFFIINIKYPTPKREDENTKALVLNIAEEMHQLEKFYFNKVNENSLPINSVIQPGNNAWKNFTAFALSDEFVHSNYCTSSRVKETEWKGNFIETDTVNPEVNFLPTKLEESPIGSAPMTPTDFIIEESDYCLKRPQMKTVAIVPTDIMNTERRLITRQTWGNVSDELGVLFFVGISKNQEQNEIIVNESQTFHDIIQGNYTDLYHLLVYKNLNAFHWLTKYCLNVKWVVHADDDCLFNVQKYVHFINNFNYSYPAKHIFCSLQCDSNPERNYSKSAISEKLYPYNTYPIYCSGFLWFTSLDNIKSLLQVVSQVKFLWIDDVFVTGLLAERANISRYSINLGNSVKSNEIENHFGWLSEGINRTQHWQKVETYYSSFLSNIQHGLTQI